MTHASKRSATTSDLRSFGLLVGGVFVALAALLAWRGRPPVVSLIPGTLGTMLMLVGVASPRLLATPYRLWMGLALLMSKVTTPVLMAVIYFVVLTPIALLRRAFGRNPLSGEGGDSRWVLRPAGERQSALDRQF